MKFVQYFITLDVVSDCYKRIDFSLPGLCFRATCQIEQTLTLKYRSIVIYQFSKNFIEWKLLIKWRSGSGSGLMFVFPRVHKLTSLKQCSLKPIEWYLMNSISPAHFESLCILLITVIWMHIVYLANEN